MALKPGKYNPLKPDIELFDYKSKKRYGLKLDGSGALQVGTISQDDTVHINAAGKRIGDFDEQRSWKGGRGIENLSTNAEGFWDSKDAWTLTAEHVHQAPLWEYSMGIRDHTFDLPSRTQSLTWQALISSNRYVDSFFTHAVSSFSAVAARIWVRRVGQPGTLTLALCSDSAGSPGTVLGTDTITVTDCPDVISYFSLFTFSAFTLTNGTKYHVKIYGASTDNKTNHWEVGGLDGGTSNLYSADGSSWSTGSFRPYFYIADSGINRKFFSFVLDEAFYVVDSRDDKVASKVWINGDRGAVTSATSTTLVASKSWTVDRWAGAFVKIVRGTGEGQVRQISSNTATTLTVSRAWDQNPASNSDFIIYGTRWFTEVATTGLNVVTGAPVVSNRIVYFPQGTGNFIRKMIYNSSTGAHSFSDEGTQTANLMLVTADSSGNRVWAFTTIAYHATAVSYSTTPANMTWTSVTVGSEETPNGVVEKEGMVYVVKDSGIWTILLTRQSTTVTATVVKLSNGIDKTPSRFTGVGITVHQQFIYYSWMHSLIRVYGASHDDVGQDWSGKGLPDGREGYFSFLDTYTSLLIAAVDAGGAGQTGTSSVLGWDGLGWHELFRAPEAGLRIRFAKVQACQETRNRLWIDVGGSLVFQEMPLMKSSPRLDSGMRYMHEAVIESSAIDMGTASGLPKFIKELTVYCENLGDGNEVHVDYQVDDDVHTSNWTEATTLFQSPESTAFLGLNNVRKFAYRLRINSSDNTAPVDILGVIPNGYARVPYKMVWTLRCRADNITSRGRLVKPDELMRWLLDNSRYPGRIEMLSQYELAHKFFVIVHPPRMFPYKPSQNGQAEESVFTIVLQEA